MTRGDVAKYPALMAEFMGEVLVKRNDEDAIVCLEHPTRMSIYLKDTKYVKFEDFNLLHEIWAKFRDLCITREDIVDEYTNYKKKISHKLINNTAEETFMELGEAIQWYNDAVGQTQKEI